MAKLLLLEDDLILQEIISEYLLELEYEVDSYFDGEKALNAVMSKQYDMLLLDIKVPEIDGFEMLEYIRELKNSTPAIFITSLSGISSLQKGFDIGANDYLKKPFDLEELHIRIEHQLQSANHEKMLPVGSFDFYPHNQYLQDVEKKIPLKLKEVQILSYLLKKRGVLVSLDELIENVWAGEHSPTYATIRTYIKNLRKILGAEAIENIKGSGYRLNIV